jgi:hypothetical protein
MKEWLSVQTPDRESALYMAVDSGSFVILFITRKMSLCFATMVLILINLDLPKIVSFTWQ